MFEFLDYSQFLEICTASKEVMLFHDNGFVLLWFAGGFNESSNDCSTHNVMVRWKDQGIPQLAVDITRSIKHHAWLFSTRSFCDEFWCIFGNTLSNVSSNIHDEGETFNSFYLRSYH